MVKPKKLGSKERQTALEKHFTTVLHYYRYTWWLQISLSPHCSIQKHGVGGTCSYVVRAVAARWLLLQALALLAKGPRESRGYHPAGHVCCRSFGGCSIVILAIYRFDLKWSNTSWGKGYISELVNLLWYQARAQIIWRVGGQWRQQCWRHGPQLRPISGK